MCWEARFKGICGGDHFRRVLGAAGVGRAILGRRAGPVGYAHVGRVRDGRAVVQVVGGPQALPFDAQAQYLDFDGERASPEEIGTLAPNALDTRKTTIYGGSNEVQRNILAQARLAP